MEILITFLDYVKLNVEYNFIFTFFLFFVFMLFYNSFSLPGNIIFMASAGYFFGIILGFFLSIMTLVFGSFLFFIFFHHFLKIVNLNFIDKHIKSLQNHISKSTISYLIIFRMIPGIPLFLQNLFLSFINISKKNFLISSFFGFTPIVFIVVFIGHTINDINKVKALSISDFFSYNSIIFILFLSIILGVKCFYKKK